jgi:hypothetical protein
MVAFKISTKSGYYVRPERIAGYKFPESLTGDNQSATIFNLKQGQKKIKDLENRFGRKSFSLIEIENKFNEIRDKY